MQGVQTDQLKASIVLKATPLDRSLHEMQVR
jgi:hypothetical protein